LAPVYDMAPARYAGRQGQLSAVAFELPVPGAADSAVWDGASRAALELWQRTAAHRLVSPGFRRIAAANAAKVQAWRAVGRLLPV
jgi:hypothetical protein